MSVCAKDFHDSALAFASSSDEMSKRNAISRAYYAAYHESIIRFPPKQDEWKESGKGMHWNYSNQLMQGDLVQRSIGLKLKQLHSRRITADYKCSENLKASDLATQLTHTEDVFQLLK